MFFHLFVYLFFNNYS